METAGGGGALQGLATSIDQLFRELEASRKPAPVPVPVAAEPAGGGLTAGGSTAVSDEPAHDAGKLVEPAVEAATTQDGKTLGEPADESPTAQDGEAHVEPAIEAATAAQEVVPAPATPDQPSPAPARERENLAAKLEIAVATYLGTPAGSRVGLAEGVLGAARALERAGDLAAVTDAVERLTLEEDTPLGECLALARELLSPAVAQAVAHRLGAASRDELLRERRVRSVARLGEPMVQALGAALSEATDRGPRRSYIDALIALGERALPVVEAMTLDTRWFVVRNAMRVLREVAGERAVPHFTAALAHDDARVRREALLSLAHVRGEAAALLAPTKISDSDPEVRQAAAMACGEIRVARAVKPLLEQLEREEDVEVQTAILLALGQIGDPGAVHAIEKYAESGFFGRKADPQVRVAGYRALAAIGTPHARKLVETALEDRDPEIRQAVARFPVKSG